jgi:RND family efflux transporter MFP subunit
LVAQGASVQAGQPIIELDTSLPAADVAEKVAGRDAAAAALELLESLPRPEEQRINQLAIEQARVALERAQSLLDNLKPLEARNEVSQQQMFDAQKAVEQARLQKESAEAQFRVSMLAPRAEAIAEAKARIGIAQRAANTSQARLDLHVIRAPVDGVLQDLTCHPGQTIAVGAPVGEIVDTRQVYVRAWLPPRSAREVRVGQKAKVFIDMHFEAAVGAIGSEGASDTESFLSAEVVFVGRVADVQTGNLPVRCLVENSDGQLAIGQTVGLAITVHAGAEVLSVPAAAIFDLGEGPVLCVVRDGKAMQLHPQLGISEDGWVAVSDTDLDAGEQVIVEGGYNLEDETPVKVEGDAPAKEADGQ